jgi:hypothetical protein
MWRRVRAPAAAAVLIFAGGCGGSTPASSLTGFGATVAAWNNAHSKASTYAGLPAYGPTISTPQGPSPQFVQVEIQSGRISQYIEVLPNGTSLAAAKRAALANLPSTAVAKSFVTTTSCSFWNFTSDDVGTALGSPQIAVEMSYDDSSGSPYWIPNNVNTLSFQTGRAESTDVC